jgi:hypothetical protein
MATKVDLSNTLVAYFDGEAVPEPGIYTLKGDAHSSEVRVLEPAEVERVKEDDMLDDDGNVASPGVEYNVVVRDKKTPAEIITVDHHTNMLPDVRVYASPDGDGFQYEDPSADEDEE